MVFKQKPLEKANFIVKKTGPAGQFWQMESAISKSVHVPCVLLEIKPRLLGIHSRFQFLIRY